MWVLVCSVISFIFFFFFKQKTAYEMRISDWSSDVCSSDLTLAIRRRIAYIIPMYDYVSVTIADAASPTPVRDGTIKLHDEAGFAGMRKAGRLSAEILDALVPFVQPGVPTAEIDDLVRTMMLEGGGIPATLGYRGFTPSC